MFLIRTKYRPRIMSAKNTIKYINKHNCSIARFGDGEFRLILKQLDDIGFQKKSDLLSEKLLAVLGSTNKRVLVCIPGCFNSLKDCNDAAKIYWKSWSFVDNHQMKVMSLIKSNSGHLKLFGDAQVTRPYIDWKNNKRAKVLFPMLKKLWDNKDIIIVEGSQTRMGIGNDLLCNAKSIKRIIAPAVDAFFAYDEIKQAIKDVYNGELILLALGPTATVLAYEMTVSDNMQIIDIGHIDIEYEWFLMQAKTKTVIQGKFTNEVSGGRTFSECNDNEYISQIVKKISI